MLVNMRCYQPEGKKWLSRRGQTVGYWTGEGVCIYPLVTQLKIGSIMTLTGGPDDAPLLPPAQPIDCQTATSEPRGGEK